MRLKQLDLIKYGKFDGESLVFEKSAQDFHVIVGPNEAGKSTVRNAVLELLFGMPMRTPLAFRHELSDLRLGGVLDSDKGEKVFHRARGKTPLRTPEDEKLPDDYLSGILGGASKEFFEQMFGLDHEKLVEGGRSILDASKDLGRVLFQSSSGIASLGPVRDALDARAGEIWAPRKSSSEYAVAEARFSEAATELKQTQVRTKVWADAKAGLDGIGDAIEQAKAQRLQLETQRSMLERVRRLAPTVSELKSAESELAALGDVIDMPQLAYADLNKGFTELASAQRVFEERQRDLEARQREREELKTDDSVLEFSADIAALDEARGACVNYLRDLLLRKAEVSRLVDEARALAQQLAWPTDDAALRDYLPNALALKTALQLFNRHESLLQAANHAREVATEKAQDIETLRELLNGLSAKELPGELRQALSDAQAMRHSKTRQLTLKNEVHDAQARLEEALLALGRWKREAEHLRGMDLPSATRVSDIARQLQTCDTAVANARDRLAEAQTKLEQLQLEQKHFTESYKVVTRTEVLDARADRDAAWNNVKTHAITIDAGAPAIDAAIRLADELADTELRTATDAANLQSMKQQIEHAAADVERAQKSLDDQQQLHTQHRCDWDALMQSVGLPGMAVHDFPEWLAKREAVFTAQDNLRRLQREFDTEKNTCTDAEAALRVALKNVGLDVAASTDLAALISIADNFVRSADAAAAQQEKLQQQMAQAETSLKNSKIKEEAATKAYDEWSAQWQHAVAEAKLTRASATLAQAASAIEIAGTIAEKLSVAEEIRRTRIQTMQADLDALEADTRRVCVVLDASLLTLGDWPEVIRRLVARQRAAMTAAQSVRLADEASRLAAEKKADAELSLAAAEARIKPLLRIAGVETIEQALPIAEKSDRRRALQSTIDHAANVLVKDGDGLTRDAIEAEIAAQDLTEVIVKLEQIKRVLAVAIEHENTLAQQQLAARQAFDAINGAANAATAEAKRQEALAAMGEAAEQYIETTTAKRLLKWAIDRYRDQKQGPMLQRAGEVFAGLTLGQFTRLVVDYEATPPALFARRRSGKQVDVSGLSEGTRDQLFLALRIAALELHLQHSPSLPFIADDLFINFDDERSKAGFEALKELSKHTQVIFLTHHDHLIPVIRDVLGSNVNVIQLERESHAA